MKTEGVKAGGGLEERNCGPCLPESHSALPSFLGNATGSGPVPHTMGSCAWGGRSRQSWGWKLGHWKPKNANSTPSGG